MRRLLQILKNNGVLKNPEIERAILDVDRKDFVLPESRDFAYINEALAIGHGQTISQPYVVAFMLELLDPKPGQKILEVGYGSGWQTALLAYLVGAEGHVDSFEILPELCTFGKTNVEKYPGLAEHVTLHCKNAAAPEKTFSHSAECENVFDRVISAAAVTEIPDWWREYLKPGGIIVYPKKYSVWKETKNKSGSWTTEEYPGFVFVPFV